MLWLIPFLLVCLFLLFRFVSPYEPLWTSSYEPFDATPPAPSASPAPSAPLLVSDAFRKAYEEFLGFYTPFQERWRDALLRTWGLEQGPSSTGKQREPTDKELAGEVAKLIQTQGIVFPPPPSSLSPSPKGSLPAPSALQTLDDLDKGRLLDLVPKTVDPYQHAMDWMNNQMLRAEKELEKALQGGGLPALEGFAGKETCGELSQCFRDNPELVRQLLLAQQEEAGSRLERTERELMSRFAQFRQPKLVSAFELNSRLTKKAKETEAKAQSGDWIKDVRIGSSAAEGKVKIKTPPGGDALEELRQKDPARYKALKGSSPSLFSVKQLMEQITQGLR